MYMKVFLIRHPLISVFFCIPSTTFIFQKKITSSSNPISSQLSARHKTFLTNKNHAAPFVSHGKLVQ